MRIARGLLAALGDGERIGRRGARARCGGAVGGQALAPLEDVGPLALDGGRARVGYAHEVADVGVLRRDAVDDALGVAA